MVTLLIASAKTFHLIDECGRQKTSRSGVKMVVHLPPAEREESLFSSPPLVVLSLSWVQIR